MVGKLGSAAVRNAFASGTVTRADLELVAKYGATNGPGAAAMEKLASAAGLKPADVFQLRSFVATLLAEPVKKEQQVATGLAQQQRQSTLGFEAEEPKPKGLFSRIGKLWDQVLGDKPRPSRLLGLPDARQSKTVKALLQDEQLTMLKKGIAGYEPSGGGPVTLGHGSVVEGSIDFGGLQPHYVIDVTHPSLQKLCNAAQKIGDGGGTKFDKVAKVVALVQKTLTDGSYDGPRYLDLLEGARKSGRNVSLGEYIDVHSGVCRENALLTHVLLREAGIESHYAYGVAQQDGRIEDHAVCLLPDGEKTWVVDSYNRNFHGAELSDLFKVGGSGQNDARMPGAADERSMLECTLWLAPYPMVWNPVNAPGGSSSGSGDR